MEAPRHLLKTYFADTRFPLIQHHIDSYDDFLDVGIPTFLRASNPFELEIQGTAGTRRFVRVYIGGKDGSKTRYVSPTEDDESIVAPHTCRLDNRTYALTLFADMLVEYTFPDGSTESKTFPDVEIGQIPLMLRSRLCYLTGVPNTQIGECAYELGGYFIIDGAEKVLLTQELLGMNTFAAGSRTRKAPKGTTQRLVEADEPILFSDVVDAPDIKYEEVKETYVTIKTMSEDGVRGPYSHFLVVPSPTLDATASDGNYGRDYRLATMNVSGFAQPVPLFSLFRALGCASDRDIYDTVLAGVPDADRPAYDEILYELLLSHDKFLGKQNATDLTILAEYTRSKSRFEVVEVLYDRLFSHVEGSPVDDGGALLRRKAYMLGSMLKMALDVDLGRRQPTDRDNIQTKRFTTSGVLMFEEFKRAYRENAKEMLQRMDKRHTYELPQFKEKALVNLVTESSLYHDWRKYFLLSQFSRAFKGMWGDRVGISQELMRVSYLSVIHHLRKTDLQIDKSTSTAPPRRLYASQYGLLCPVDSPDGSDIGYKKSLTLFARVTTAIPAAELKTRLLKTGLVREVQDIHPSTWKPEWTRITINSDLWGVCIGNTEDLHTTLLTARRAGEIPLSVSLAWMRRPMCMPSPVMQGGRSAQSIVRGRCRRRSLRPRPGPRSRGTLSTSMPPRRTASACPWCPSIPRCPRRSI